MRRRRFLWILLLVAGLARAAPPAAPAPSAALRIATWNIAWLQEPGGGGKIRRRASDYARLAAYAARIRADIVAVQEIGGAEALGRLFDPAVYAFHLTADADNPQRTGFVFRRDLAVTIYPDLAGLALGGTRRGADIGVRIGAIEMRLLSVHLKSGCWGGPLTTPGDACAILRAQLPVLEDWIDARARARAPFAVLGDFNRRFGDEDPFWRAIDDGDPEDARLRDVARGLQSGCWGGQNPGFIDHIVLGRRAAAWVVPGSFTEVLFADADLPRRTALSDHCPIAVSLSPAPITVMPDDGSRGKP